jgi:hypothetical protein
VKPKPPEDAERRSRTQAGGTTWVDVLKLTIFLVDARPCLSFGPHATSSQRGTPADALVQVEGLVRPDVVIEIGAIAAVPQGQRAKQRHTLPRIEEIASNAEARLVAALQVTMKHLRRVMSGRAAPAHRSAAWDRLDTRISRN